MDYYLVEYHLIEKRRAGFVIVEATTGDDIEAIASDQIKLDHDGHEFKIDDTRQISEGKICGVVATDWSWT